MQKSSLLIGSVILGCGTLAVCGALAQPEHRIAVESPPPRTVFVGIVDPTNGRAVDEDTLKAIEAVGGIRSVRRHRGGLMLELTGQLPFAPELLLDAVPTRCVWRIAEPGSTDTGEDLRRTLDRAGSRVGIPLEIRNFLERESPRHQRRILLAELIVEILAAHGRGDVQRFPLLEDPAFLALLPTMATHVAVERARGFPIAEAATSSARYLPDLIVDVDEELQRRGIRLRDDARAAAESRRLRHVFNPWELESQRVFERQIDATLAHYRRVLIGIRQDCQSALNAADVDPTRRAELERRLRSATGLATIMH